jgi:phosphoribosyl 1,2-cyclic phosphate phosphodiesterase
MNSLGEERTRTCFLLNGAESILVDCGPDIRAQMRKHGVQRPDVVLITHEHGDHFLGLDDLLAFRRSVPRNDWVPIPVYASERTWEAMEVRFGYLVGSLIERREAVPGQELEETKTRIIPFKTNHGPTASGSIGYFLEMPGMDGSLRVVYTSDFIGLDEEPGFLFEPDILVLQSHWLNEPAENRPHHMSFQNAMEYLRRWKPRLATYLVHVSAGDLVPGDPSNNSVGKWPPAEPLLKPGTTQPYPIPRCQSEWQNLIDTICEDMDLPQPMLVAYDGMKARF